MPNPRHNSATNPLPPVYSGISAYPSPLTHESTFMSLGYLSIEIKTEKRIFKNPQVGKLVPPSDSITLFHFHFRQVRKVSKTVQNSKVSLHNLPLPPLYSEKASYFECIKRIYTIIHLESSLP
jgi:hypothetical protein